MRKLRITAGIFVILALMSVTYRVGIVEAQSYPGYYKYLLYALNAAGNPVALNVNASGNLITAAGSGYSFAAGTQPPKGWYPALMYGLNSGNPSAANVDGTGAMVTSLNGGAQTIGASSVPQLTIQSTTAGYAPTQIQFSPANAPGGDHIWQIGDGGFYSQIDSNFIIGNSVNGASLTIDQNNGVKIFKGLTAGGSTASFSGCGTATSIVGGMLAGQFVGGSTTCNPVITPGFTAPHGFSCEASDFTTAITFRQTATTTTTATMTASGTAGATDTINFKCIAY